MNVEKRLAAIADRIDSFSGRKAGRTRLDAEHIFHFIEFQMPGGDVEDTRRNYGLPDHFSDSDQDDVYDEAKGNIDARDPKVLAALDRWENEVERTVKKWVKDNLDALKEGTELDDLLTGRFFWLLFMQSIGHGVTLEDGDFDHLFTDDIRDLSRELQRKHGREAVRINEGVIQNAADEAFEQAVDGWKEANT